MTYLGPLSPLCSAVPAAPADSLPGAPPPGPAARREDPSPRARRPGSGAGRRDPPRPGRHTARPQGRPRYLPLMRVYADHGATTPVDPRVAAAMLPYFSQTFGNAGSIHAWGQEAREAVGRAREIGAGAVGA